MKRNKNKSDSAPNGEKIQKVIAHLGYGSRRQIETWISAGRIKLNNRLAKLGDRATPADLLELDGKKINTNRAAEQRPLVLVYNKPVGEICSHNDPQKRPTIFDNLPSLNHSKWISVGRLDINSSGLILLTNNGELAQRLMHPSRQVEREYLVRVRGALSAGDITKLTKSGISIDGKLARITRISALTTKQEGSNKWYQVVLREGRNREIRRLMLAVKHEVSRLKRVRYGSVRLPRSLKSGSFVKMAPRQLDRLMQKMELLPFDS